MSIKVGESTGYVPNLQMSVFGYIIAAIMVIVLLPLLPILVPAWILWRTFVAEPEAEPRYATWRNELEATRADADEETPDETDGSAAAGDHSEEDESEQHAEA